MTDNVPLMIVETPDGTYEEITDPDYAELADEFDEVLSELAAAKDAKADAEERVAALTERAIKLSEMCATGDHFAIRGHWARINRSSQRKFNLAKLRQLLGVGAFELVTTPKIDTKEYDRLLAAGVISAQQNAACVTVTPKSPYITFSSDPRTSEQE